MIFRLYRGRDVSSNPVELLYHSRGKSVLFARLGALFNIAATKATTDVFLPHWPSRNHECIYGTSLNVFLIKTIQSIIYIYIYCGDFRENWPLCNATALYNAKPL